MASSRHRALMEEALKSRSSFEISRKDVLSSSFQVRRSPGTNEKNSPDSDRLNSGEVSAVSAVSRTVTDDHSGPHRGVQGRESPPAAPPPPFLATLTARRLTGLGPFLFLRRLGPNHSAQHTPVQPSALPGGFSFRRAIRSDPIHPTIFYIFIFIFTEKPLNFPD
ncbi:hypothetical protein CRG98_028723 [Punica granatum]|uniref:Uncharacterized protein n=1 Tax=Punica granatum TaxID=22663 RepID=A0A2I0J3U1_PUNGR|nr:hypothetical protein CRG98_028723 [Punica granatum]